MRGSSRPCIALDRTRKPQRNPELLGILEGAAFCARRTAGIRDERRLYPRSGPEAQETYSFQQRHLTSMIWVPERPSSANLVHRDQYPGS